MNADNNFSNFALDVVLKKISESHLDGVGKKRIGINITLDYGVESFEEYERSLKFLKQKNILEKFRGGGHAETIKHEQFDDLNVYVYTPTFVLNVKRLNEFLVATSRIPKYSLKMGIDRKLILNDKHLLVTPNFSSSNWYFMDYCLKHSGEIVTKKAVEQSSGKDMPRFHSILDNLNIAPTLTDIFFPNVAGDAVQFRNNVMAKDLPAELDEHRINRFIKTLTKIK